MRTQSVHRLLAILLLCISCFGCRTNAVITSGVDPTLHPLKSDALFLALPSDATIRERQAEQVIRTVLQRDSFNLVDDPDAALWILSFSVDRETYVAGWDSRGATAEIGSSGLAISRSSSTVRRQTDVTVFMRLFNSKDRAKEKPPLFWEGSLTTADRTYRDSPYGLVRALLGSFGQDSYRKVRVGSELH